MEYLLGNSSSQNATTLEAKHESILTQFANSEQNIADLHKELNKLFNEREKINLRLDSFQSDNDINPSQQFLHMKLANINNKIRSVQTQIDDISKESSNYHLNTIDVLDQYYDSSSTVQNQEDEIETVVNNSSNDVMSMLFENSSSSSNSNKEKTSSNKAVVFGSYLNIVDPKALHGKKNKSNKLVPTLCPTCGTEMTLFSAEGLYTCTSCGLSNYTIVDSERPNYKDPPTEMGYFAYKRINHFNEWLAQFQAKESTEIPQHVLNLILVEIKKERISNMATISNTKMREFLKRLKLNKYYEHIPHIIDRLNGKAPMIMTRDLEEKLRSMFKEIQAPFIKYCPKDRKNFLSYSYVLHKFVQLLGHDEYLPSFPLLKSREKLHNQDLIWQKICDDLDWQFIKSI
jgi:hypothetical protein